MQVALYSQLMRLHQPVGIWLLFWPCAWAISLPPLHLDIPVTLALFFLGSVAMRGAGCIVNDIWDRKIDAQVERTRHRPLASGAVSLNEALWLLAALLLFSLWIVSQLPLRVFGLALLSLPLVALYPAMKRLTWWPQAFLGFTFNFGALMGWLAVHETLEPPAFALYAAGICWTLGYDTIYAHQDILDDAKIGVKSTARLFGSATRGWVAGFFTAMLAFLALAGLPFTHLPLLALPLAVQLWQLDIQQPERCGRQFRFHALYGALVWLTIILEY